MIYTKKNLHKKTQNLRDLHTVPMTNREQKWFYVYVEDGKLYVESAKNNMPKSNIKRTKMDEKKFEIMLPKL